MKSSAVLRIGIGAGLIALTSGSAFSAAPTSRPDPAPASQPASRPSNVPPGHPSMPSNHPGMGTAGQPSGPELTRQSIPIGPLIVLLPSGKPPAPVKAVTLVVLHRVFHDFAEVHKVALNEEFQIGDTEYRARIVQYVPDFVLGMKSHDILTRSNEPNNPAFRLLVTQNGAPQDTTWAFVRMMPHFARKSLLAFNVERIDFKGHRSIVAPPDSTGAGGPKR